MENEDRLLTFLKNKLEPGEKELHLSAYRIADELTILKNKRVTKVIPVETPTSRAYVHQMLKNLEKDKKIIYKIEGTKTPTIKIL